MKFVLRDLAYNPSAATGLVVLVVVVVVMTVILTHSLPAI